MYVFSAVRERNKQNAAKSVFMKFVFGLNGPECGIIHWLCILLQLRLTVANRHGRIVHSDSDKNDQGLAVIKKIL